MADAWMIKPLLVLFGIWLILLLFRLFLNRQARKMREKARAKIWREEYKNK